MYRSSFKEIASKLSAAGHARPSSTLAENAAVARSEDDDDYNAAVCDNEIEHEIEENQRRNTCTLANSAHKNGCHYIVTEI